MSKVSIRGKEYELQSFSDLHLSTVNALLADLGNLQAQSDAGFVLSEVIFPDLSSDIVRLSPSGRYILLLNARELNDVIISVIKFYYDSELKKAQESKDTVYEDQIRRNITELQINDVLIGTGDAIAEDDVASLRAKLKKLEEK